MPKVFKIIFSLLFVVFTNASRCPEIRKPHVTSCVIFYNCINLPEGGYVWAPSTCADGLVFQPLLRLCVLPGDTWTCDNELDHSAIDDQTFHTSELIDKTKTSYDGLITNDMVYSLDSTHKTDTLSNLGNALTTLPYPLIEIDDKHKINSDLSPISIKRLENNMLQVNHGKEYIPVTLIEVKDEENNKVPNLKSFINRIFFYQHFAPSLNHQTFVSSPSINPSTVTNSQHISNNVLNYLIENYIFNRKSDYSKPINPNEVLINVKTTTEKVDIASVVQPNIISTTEKTPIDVDNIDQLNNILAINGNLGRKEYVTIEKYKSWPNNINIEIVEVIPCSRAHRLPNATDCMRYYTCDPTSAEIHEFICPPNTAFNNQINLCDTKKYKLCKLNGQSMKFQRIPNTMELSKIILTNEYRERETTAAFKLCETTGKFPDITSDKFYYLCYSSKTSGKIESFRMACPNNLIFCQDRNVCTVKQFCNNLT